MGLNRMMMKNGEVTVVDGYKSWDWTEADNKTISFTVPPGIERIKVISHIDGGEGDPNIDNYAGIQNTSTKIFWGKGWLVTDFEGSVAQFKDIYSIVGVTPNKTYRLLLICYNTSGVTFSWGKAINAMIPTVEDY